MKILVVIFFVLYGFSLLGQEKEIKKPSYIIIVNKEIISQEKLEEYGKRGLIKSMNKGVTQKERDELAEIYGNRIEEKEFIIKVNILTEEELLKKRSETNPEIISSVNKNENELKLNIGDSARNFSVFMIDGTEISLSALKGKVVLLNYWATWCAPCLMEFAEIPGKILSPFGGKDFVFIPIAIGENKEKVSQKMQEMKKYGVDFNAGFDPTKKIWYEYATGAIPKNFILDKNGIIRYISIGNAEGNIDNLALEIKKLLSE